MVNSVEVLLKMEASDDMSAANIAATTRPTAGVGNTFITSSGKAMLYP